MRRLWWEQEMGFWFEKAVGKTGVTQDVVLVGLHEHLMNP